VVHALVQFAFALVLSALAVAAVLTWRLSRGPIDVPWLATALEHAASADTPVHVTLGGAALAWEGFSVGLDRPLDIQVHDVIATDAAGERIAAIPTAKVSLATAPLLLGRVVPRAIEVDGARMRVLRAADGDVTLDLGSRPEPSAPTTDPSLAVSGNLLQDLLHPPPGAAAEGLASRWSLLRRVRIHDAAVSVTDRQLAADWELDGVEINLERESSGGVAGRAHAILQVGDLTAPLGVTAQIDTRTHRTGLTASLGQFVPAALAAQVQAAKALAPLDAPVALSGDARLSPELAPEHFSLRAEIGTGTLRLPRQATPVLDAAVEMDGTPEQVTVDVPQLKIAPRPGGRPTVLRAHADLARAADGAVTAAGTLDLDQVAFADLPALWPEGVGGPGSRPWIVNNITDGVARNGHLDFGLRIPPDIADAEVTRLEGGIDGQGLTVHWLRPVPPIEDGAARLSLAGTDALEITVTDGRQAGGSEGGLRIKGGRVLFSNFNEKDQFLDLSGDIAGPVPDLLTLLRNPRVRLLERSPLPVTDAAGQIAGKVTVTHLPLRDALSMDDVNIRTSARLTGLRLAGVAAGRDLDHGMLSLEAGPEGLHAEGSATLAGLPADLQLDMDFRAGPPTEVLEKAHVTGSADARQVAALGLDAGDALSGTVGLDGVLTVRRDRISEAVVTADLAKAKLALPVFGYAKPAGQPATLAATLHLDGGQVTSIVPVRLDGAGVQMQGEAVFADGRPDVLRLQRLVLGSFTDLHGEVRLPHRVGEPWRIDLGGASVDVASEFERKPGPETPPPAEPKRGPPYVADLRFDRVVLGPARAIAGLVAHAENDGLVLRQATVTGRTVTTGAGSTAGGAPFQLAIEPKASVRRLSISTSDAGGLLLALDVEDKMLGGRMTITGSYDDSRPGHPLSGTAVIENFRVRNAPALGRLLEGMTLYGVVDLLRGPGLGFARLEAPFRYSSDILELADARAFSSSLGMTAKGRIDLARETADLQGTIVPAYFFNSLLGDIPLIGRLFSPERGGGVFAATYTVRGPLDNPTVSVNPLAALTPGFLRGVFGLGSSTGSTPPAQRHLGQ
jgi:hypothetical protein